MITVGNKWVLYFKRESIDVAELKISTKGKSEGKQIETPPYLFYPNLEIALTSLIDRDINDTDFSKLEEIVEKINEYKQFVRDNLAELKAYEKERFDKKYGEELKEAPKKKKIAKSVKKKTTKKKGKKK